LLILLAVGWRVVAAWPPERFAQWRRCWSEASSDRVRGAPSLEATSNQTDWEDLSRVADYLRGQGVKDRELLCFNTPATRYVQPVTLIRALKRRWETEIKKELEETRPPVYCYRATGSH
jgi:hypothetical protein